MQWRIRCSGELDVYLEHKNATNTIHRIKFPTISFIYADNRQSIRTRAAFS